MWLNNPTTCSTISSLLSLSEQHPFPIHIVCALCSTKEKQAYKHFVITAAECNESWLLLYQLECFIGNSTTEKHRLLHIMCGYQCDKAVNKNDTREVM